MQIRTFHPSEQVDVAVDLGAVPPELPRPCFLEELAANPPTPPPQLIEGILHQGCKMILGGTSKSNKSWCLLDLALSVASGQPWWGRACAKLPVVYINFELHVWAVAENVLTAEVFQALDLLPRTECLRTSRSWVYQATASGRLPSIRVGHLRRFDPVKIRAWATANASGSEPT